VRFCTLLLVFIALSASATERVPVTSVQVAGNAAGRTPSEMIPSHLFDGNYKTAWAPPDSLADRPITILLDKTYDVTLVGIAPGYQKSDSRMRDWGIPAQVVLTVGYDSTVVMLPDNQEMAYYLLSRPEGASEIRLSVVDVRRGKENALPAISEIAVFAQSDRALHDWALEEAFRFARFARDGNCDSLCDYLNGNWEVSFAEIAAVMYEKMPASELADRLTDPLTDEHRAVSRFLPEAFNDAAFSVQKVRTGHFVLSLAAGTLSTLVGPPAYEIEFRRVHDEWRILRIWVNVVKF
jgi:hypothetical protein